MGYVKQNFVPGHVLKAEEVNKIEQGIVDNEAAIAGKQPKGDYLTEHQKIKTINGVSLVGEGNIEISGGETSEQEEYSPVKYLENTGTQYIDTGYVLHENDVIEVDYQIPASALDINTDKILIDARDSSNGVRVSTYGKNYKWYARFGHGSGTTSAVYRGLGRKQEYLPF